MLCQEKLKIGGFMLYEDGDTDRGNDSEQGEIAAADLTELARQEEERLKQEKEQEQEREREEAERIEIEAAKQREAHENTIEYDEGRAAGAQNTQAATDLDDQFAGIEGLGKVIDDLVAAANGASIQNHEKGPVKSGMSKAVQGQEHQGQDAENDGGREG